MKIKVLELPEGVLTPESINRAWLNLEFEIESEDEYRYYVTTTELAETFYHAKQPIAAQFWIKIGGPVGLPKKICHPIPKALLS